MDKIYIVMNENEYGPILALLLRALFHDCEILPVHVVEQERENLAQGEKNGVEH